MLWGVSLFFGQAMQAFDQAAVATFSAIETAAIASKTEMEELRR